MAETKRGVRVGWEALREFCEEVLGAAGVPENDARIVAASLVDADLAGMKSHGVTRLNDYLLRMEQVVVEPGYAVRLHTRKVSVHQRGCDDAGVVFGDSGGAKNLLTELP